MRARRQRAVAMVILLALWAGLLLPGAARAESAAEPLHEFRSPPSARLAKLGQILTKLRADYLAHIARRGAADAASFQPAGGLLRVADGYVLVDLVAAGDPQALRADLQALGAIGVSVHKSLVSARVPIARLDEIDGLASLLTGRPALFITWAGATTTQGDIAQRSAAARTAFGVDGTGITVGVLSDSYDCQSGAAGDIASGDLPGGVTLLQESCPGGDEGRAMLQIIHDVAPGASLAFHSANGGQAAFANGIGSLVAAGADVVVDDAFYFGEPMFQDGVIAQAVDAAVAGGVAHFSSAGNAAAASYESEFRNSGQAGPFGGILHDFDPGAATVTAQPLTIPVGTTMTLVIQWDQPFASVSGPPGAGTELLVTLTASNGSTRLVSSLDSNLSGDPVDAFEFTNNGSLPQGSDTRFFLKIENLFGPDPGLIKYLYVDGGGGVTIDQFDTRDGTAYGHSSAAGSMSVGAAAYYETPAFGVTPPLLEPFSSRGNVPVLFRTDGTSIIPPELRLKPVIVAPDRGNTTFFGNDSDGDGFPNFAGTSAAAPHAAGVAALLLDFNTTLTPGQVYSAMADSSLDMLDPGYDFDSGFGLVQADTAIGAISNAAPVLGPIDGRVLAAGESTSIPVSATDSDGPAPTLSAPVLPGFCSLSGTAGSGSVGCSPTAAHVGRHPLVVTATDSGTPTRSVSQGVYLVVTGTPVNSAPVLGAIGNQSVVEGASLGVPLSASDPNGDGMSLSAAGLPGFCVLTDNGNGTGSIDCNPSTGQAGTYPVTVTVTDTGTPPLTDSETFDIVVTSPVTNQAPVLAPIGNRSVDENASLAIALSATDANGDGLAFGTTGLPAFCGLTDNLNGTGSIDCNPAIGSAGTYPVTVTVTDDGSPAMSDSETFDIIVSAAAGNQAPVLAEIGDQTVDENASLSVPLSASDADGDELLFDQSGFPAFCGLVDNRDGTANISCNPGFDDSGTYTVTVSVQDDGVPVLSDSETFDIVVNNVNAAPVLEPVGDQFAKENRTHTFDLIASDPDGDALSFGTTGLPAFCILTDNGNGTASIGCGPNAPDVGTYLVTVTVSDNGVPALSDSESISLVVLDRSTQHDMNGDGMSDILWRNRASGQNWLYLMNGPSIASSAGINTVNLDWEIVGNGDYDDDGNNDILWRNKVNGQNWMYRMSGASVVESLGVNTVGNLDWQIVGNGDFNGDGKADILWRNGVTGQNWLYLMNGATIAASAGINTVGPAWQIAAIGDFDGDGRSDILWRHSVTGQNWMYLMNGASILTSAGVNTVSNMDWQVAGAGDYNGDGRSDILWRNQVTGQNWMYLMNGAAVASSAGVNTVANLAWSVAASGDYNGDGNSDILWRNRLTGQNWLYLMDGQTVVQSSGVNTVANLDWEIVAVD